MNCNFIIDSYAWLEYFRASKAGEVAKEYIENENAVTPTVVVAEISRKLLQEIKLGNETAQGRLKRLDFIRATSRIVELDFETAAEAGKVNEEQKGTTKGWGLVDSIILCTARNLNGKVVTGDEHFRQLDEVVFIKA
ncbi:MAG: type II toxin-antitoxin system VapC family toxin [Candidatus Bathyarchaeia archaeon]